MCKKKPALWAFEKVRSTSTEVAGEFTAKTRTRATEDPYTANLPAHWKDMNGIALWLVRYISCNCHNPIGWAMHMNSEGVGENVRSGGMSPRSVTGFVGKESYFGKF